MVQKQNINKPTYGRTPLSPAAPSTDSKANLSDGGVARSDRAAEKEVLDGGGVSGVTGILRKSSKPRKLAIVCSGGGMTCSYTAGFLSALAKEYGFTKPDIIIAGSGSAGTAAYYVAKHESVTNIWANRLSNRHFLNIFRFWKIMDIDYLIDDVMKKQEPLDINAVYDSRINFLIPVTNCQSGEVVYMSNKNHDDIFEALRATKAMPIIYGKRVQIGNARYFDSRVGTHIQTSIAKAIELGATDIIAVANNNPRLLARLIYGVWVWTRNAEFNKNYKKLSTNIKHADFSKQANILIIRPKTKLKIRGLNNNQKLLQKTIKQGYDECKNNKDIKRLLKIA